jgi:hypothetical protein
LYPILAPHKTVHTTQGSLGPTLQAFVAFVLVAYLLEEMSQGDRGLADIKTSMVSLAAQFVTRLVHVRPFSRL